MELLAKKIEILEQQDSDIDKERLYALLKDEIFTKLVRASCTGFYLDTTNEDFDRLYNFLYENKIIGLISKREAQALFQLAQQSFGPIVEVGTHFGFSTIFLANHQDVYAIDFQFDQVLREIDPGFRYYFGLFYDVDCADLTTNISDTDSKLEICRKNWKIANVEDKITTSSKDAMEVVQDVPFTSFVFYDACHSYESIKHIDAYFAKVVNNGVIAIHDFNSGSPGVVGAVYDFYSRNKSILQGPFLVDSLIWFRKLEKR